LHCTLKNINAGAVTDLVQALFYEYIRIANPDHQTIKTVSMKKILLTAALFASLVSFANPGVDAKVLDAFQATFSQAQEVAWSVQGDVYEVKFRHLDIRTTVTYDHDGQILKTMRYYGEDKLPVMLLTRIKSKFEGKSIFGVTEVISDAGVEYHIILEDAKSWYNVKADGLANIYIERRITKA
jgi:hypothetical protein